MHRGKSQQSRQKQSKLKNTVDRPKPNQSKNKLNLDPQIPLNIYNKNATIHTSPGLIKNLDEGKQNYDLLQNIIKIMSAAASAREKQILLSLGTQAQKQKKIKGYLSKQPVIDRRELQSMLNHLRQQQMRQISSLKIEIGKRKLQVLDEHDLRQDILNLNSYVMRRSKKQSLNSKQQGADLISEIYSKFDQQAKLISNLMATDKAVSQMSNYNIYERQKQKSSKSQLLNTQKLFQKTVASQQIATYKCEKNQTEFDNTSNVNSQVSNSSTRSELMQKILLLEKDNLRLMKEVSKIQQQFECVVQQKLLLEQRLQRAQVAVDQNKNNFRKYLAMLKNKIDQNQRQVQKYRYETIQQLKNYHHQLEFDTKSNLLSLQEWYQCNLAKQVKNNQLVSQNQTGLSQAQNDQPEPSLQSQQVLIEKYQALLTQKQFEINGLLKSISKVNQEKQALNAEINLFKEKNQEKSSIFQIIKGQMSNIMNLVAGLKLKKLETCNYVNSSLYNLRRSLEEQIAYVQMKALQFVEQIQEKYYTELRTNMQKNLKNEQVIQNLQKKIQQLSQSNLTQQKLYKDQLEYKIEEKNRLISQLTCQISRLQNLIQNNKSKYQQNISQLERQINFHECESKQKQLVKQKKMFELQQLNQSLNKEMKIKQAKIQELQTLIYKINIQKQRIMLQCVEAQSRQSALKNEISQTKNQTKKQHLDQAQKMSSMVDLFQYNSMIKKLQQDMQNQKNFMIEECGMLLQQKAQQISMIKIKLERQRIIKQDLLSMIQQKHFIKQKLIVKSKLSKLKNQIKIIKTDFAFLQQILGQFIFLDQRQTQEIYIKFQQIAKARKQRNLEKFSIQSNLFDIKLCLGEKQANLEKFFLQFQRFFTKIIQSSCTLTQQHKTRILDQIQKIKLSMGKEQVFEKMNENRTYQQQRKVNSNQSSRQQLDNCEAISGCLQDGQKIIDRSSFLIENLNQLQNYSQKYLDISGILDESSIVDEVSALRYQLAQIFKRNEVLEKQLKQYQQKGIDIQKIFDF